MLRILRLLPASFALLAAGCSLMAAPNTPTSTAPVAATFTATAQPTATATALPSPTETATLTPTPAPTMAPSPSPLPPEMQTEMAMVGSAGALTNIRQYFNPAGTPVGAWNDVPIMPQATAGQEFNPYVYSYTVPATLDQARKFYAPKVALLGITDPPSTGSAGSGSQAAHEIVFLSHPLTIVLSSFDNDPAHVIVVISRVP